MQVIFGILLMGAATGSLIKDPVICSFMDSNECYVALGQQLHLQIPLEEKDQFNLKFTYKTSHYILKYKKNQNNTTNPLRWKFIIANKTMILNSAESSDTGTYLLEIFDADGKQKAIYTFRINTEVEVTSVQVSENCLFSEVRKVYCSAVGDNLRFNWTYASFIRLENGDSTLVLAKNTNTENITCLVENHVSRSHNSIELHRCPDYTLVILSTVFGLLIIISVVAFYMYRKRWSQRNKEARSQETIPRTSEAQDKNAEYVEDARPKESKHEENQNELQYGALVFNTPATKKSEAHKLQEDCVYSQVLYGQ